LTISVWRSYETKVGLSLSFWKDWH